MLLKEQALKRLHSQFQQKKAHRHRRTKSLGDDDSEVIEGNDKIATETKDKNADKESSATREASSTALKGDPPPQQRYKLWERELLSSYARLKQHYASKLQPSDANAAAPPETNGSAAVAHEGGNSPEWHRLLSEDGEVFSTPKVLKPSSSFLSLPPSLPLPPQRALPRNVVGGHCLQKRPQNKVCAVLL